MQGGRAGDLVALGGQRSCVQQGRGSLGDVWRLGEPPDLGWIQAQTLLSCLTVLGTPDLGASPQAPVAAGDPSPRLWSY